VFEEINVSIRISDVAQEAGVSPATAARVISNKGYVSDKKRAQVEQAIKKLGYVPNRIASSLRTNKPYFIGHVVEMPAENPFFSVICNTINETAEKAGYHVLTALKQGTQAKERAVIENLISLMVDAMIFTGNTASDADTIDWIQSRGISVVMIERPSYGSRVDAVLLDSYRGATLAMEHMIARGHREIGFLGMKHGQHEVEYQRYHGYRTALADHGLEPGPEWVGFVPDYTVEHGRQAINEMLRGGKIPTSLFITSDVLACGALQALYEHGIKVPDDLSIVGFDNTLSSICSPRLTSIEMQLEQAGAAAVEMILERKEGLRTGVKKVMLSPVLVDRGSVRDLTQSAEKT